MSWQVIPELLKHSLGDAVGGCILEVSFKEVSLDIASVLTFYLLSIFFLILYCQYSYC